MLTAKADSAPEPVGVAERAHRRLQRRRQVVVAASSMATLVIVVGIVQITDGSGARSDGDIPAAEAPPSASVSVVSPPEVRTGPLWRPGATESCVEEYAPRTLQHRAFAFDGVITDIKPGLTNQADKGQLELNAVTFDVQEWFKGGGGSQVTVDMGGPDGGPAPKLDPVYEVGTRLLVTGEPRWGGSPLQDAIAWGCGFTHYYDAQTALIWREVFAPKDPTR